MTNNQLDEEGLIGTFKFGNEGDYILLQDSQILHHDIYFKAWGMAVEAVTEDDITNVFEYWYGVLATGEQYALETTFDTLSNMNFKELLEKANQPGGKNIRYLGQLYMLETFKSIYSHIASTDTRLEVRDRSSYAYHEIEVAIEDVVDFHRQRLQNTL